MGVGGSNSSPRAERPASGSSSLTSSSRCPQCNPRRKEKSRNLVVCTDGTANEPGQKNTNVVKLLTKINLEPTPGLPEQLTYYSSGIGTHPGWQPTDIFKRMERAISDSIDMAIARNVGKSVMDAYSWLANMYREGDQIYLFGFSRGAYQVRVLAQVIHEVGLIRTPTKEHITAAYEHYEAICSGKAMAREIASEFKDTFSWKGLSVHFIGVWDTVSSVGLIKKDVFLSKSSSATHACHFRQALALDELRVKFMPEYFHEMNSESNDGKYKYIVESTDTKHSTPTGDKGRQSTICDDGTHPSEVILKKTGEIKEVWFAGSHSDVGGTNKPGRSYQAGNVSLLWMRREAAANGLVLEPTDIVWFPEDLDFGTRNSMKTVWKAIEYVPIRHQVSFNGAGEHARCSHKSQPRRIIPGQTVHASILYANTYQPKATIGGFDIPIVQSRLEDAELDNTIWETGLFDDTAARELLGYLSNVQGVALIYLERLLSMLRFKEGRQCVRNVPGWETQFRNLIYNRDCPQLIRLFTIVAFYEASCDLEGSPKSRAVADNEFSQDVFDNAKTSLTNILAVHKHRDRPRVVALLRPLAKHQTLREQILTPDLLETLVGLLDVIIRQREGNFGQAMDGLNCLLQCEDTRPTLVEMLQVNPPHSTVSRLSRMLAVKDTRLLIAALRVVMTLARIADVNARAACFAVKPRIRYLASKDGPLGLLAVEILLALYDPDDPHQMNIRNSHVRANLSSALLRLNPDRHDSTDGHSDDIDPGQQILRRLFGLDASELVDPQKRLIGTLKKAVEKGNVRERTAATMTLLKLCKTVTIRAYLHEIHMLDVFIGQLRLRDSALLAAYALANCLQYNDMEGSIKGNEDLPKHIVGMLMLDYFDDAVGPVEGFQIFRGFMQHSDLREKIKHYNITQVFEMKLGKGKSKEIRTSMICLDIFRSFDPDGPWTSELIDKALEHLRNKVWKAQKAGVTILSALAQTEHGVVAILPHIHKIVEMLLPGVYDSRSTYTGSSASNDSLPKPPSWMLGPACALRILAQNQKLRERTRSTTQYGSLKHLFLSGTLVDEVDTSALRVWTPNRTDVINMLDRMIKVIDEELSEEGLMTIGAAVLPHIQHWDRLATLLSHQTVAVVSILPALLGVSVLAILAVVAVVPIHLSLRVHDFVDRMLSSYQDSRILNSLQPMGTMGPPRLSGEHRDEEELVEHDSEDPSGRSRWKFLGRRGSSEGN